MESNHRNYWPCVLFQFSEELNFGFSFAEIYIDMNFTYSFEMAEKSLHQIF